MKLSLRLRVLALTVAALLPPLVVVGYTEWNINRLRRIEVHDLAERSAWLASSELDRIWEGVQTLLVAVARSRDVAATDPGACSAYLDELRTLSPQLIGLELVTADGQHRCGRPLPGRGDGSDSVPLAASQADHVVVGRYTPPSASVHAYIPVALAVRGEDKLPAGILVAGIDLDWLGERLKERGLPPEGSVTVADSDGVIIARQPLASQFVGRRIPDTFMRLVRSTEPGSEEVISQDGTPRVLGYVPPAVQRSGLYVSVGLSAEASYRAVSRATRLSAYMASFGALLALGAAWIVGDRVFRRPILRLGNTIERWRAGEREVRSGYREGTDEIGALGANLDRMMDQIGEQEEQRDLLVHELDHRVKNILATVQAVATATFKNAERTSDALPQFSERLRALARAHDILTREKWERADLQVVVDSIARPLEGPGGRFEIAGPSIDLSPRQALAFTMVLHELRTNAAKYGSLSTDDGRVRIMWTLDGEPSTIALEWREIGGPPVEAPSRTGFGTRLITIGFGRELGEVELTYPVEGCVCRIRTPVWTG